METKQLALTLFTPDPVEYTSNLDLKINNSALPIATHPKGLGLTLDPKLTYSTHIHNSSVHAHKPLQVIKTITATGWGKRKETLMATYKTVMRQDHIVASSIWLFLLSTTTLLCKEECSSPVSLQLLKGGIWACMRCLCWVLG